MTRRNNEIAQLFNRVYRGQVNFMTPDVIEYGTAGPYFYELSRGDFLGRDLYGVTLLKDHGVKCDDLNKAFRSIEEARQYLRELESESSRQPSVRSESGSQRTPVA